MNGPLPIPAGYHEWAPPESLAWALECVWTRRPSDPPSRRRVLPDGCADLIFDLGEEESLRGDSDAAPGVRALAVGTMTTPFDAELGPAAALVGLRFRPGAALPFLGCPLDQLTDRRVALDELWTRERTERMLARLAGSRSAEELAVSVEAELMEPAVATRDALVLRAAGWIVASEGRMRAGEAAERLGVTRQTLARRFHRQVGIGPKKLARIVRVRSTVARIHEAESIGWAALAVEQGFSDQAHLCSELRALTGTSPSGLSVALGCR